LPPNLFECSPTFSSVRQSLPRKFPRVDALRRRCKAYFGDGEYRDTLGAAVAVGGKRHSQYSVFVSNPTGRRALAIANPSNSEEMLFDISLPDPQRLNVVTPEVPDPKDFTG
jgi:hypothetical protein